jgi:putative ABC transport system permease protein
LLSKEFTKLVLIAFVVAAPLAYFGMSRWLQAFAFRITLGPGVFLISGSLALLIAWLTVSFQSIKAALANPVEALRYE